MKRESKIRREFIKAGTGKVRQAELWEYWLDDNDDDSHGYYISIDGVEWCDCNTLHHAQIILDLMKDHLAEKMTMKLKTD